MYDNADLRNLAQILNAPARIFKDISIYEVFSFETAVKLADEGFNTLNKLIYLPFAVLDNYLNNAQKNMLVKYAVAQKESKPFEELFGIDPVYFKSVPIDTLRLKPRAYTRLNNAGLKTVADLLTCKLEDFYSIRNLGNKSGEEIYNKIRLYLKKFKVTPASVKWAESERMNGLRNGSAANAVMTAFDKKKLDEQQTLRDYLEIKDGGFDSQNIAVLNLSVRSSNCLSKRKIKNIGELLNCSVEYLYSIKNMGVGSVNEILDKLKIFFIEPHDESKDSKDPKRRQTEYVIDDNFRAHVGELVLDPEYTAEELPEEQTVLFKKLQKAQAGLGYETSKNVHSQPENYIGASLAFFELGEPFREFLKNRKRIENALSSVGSFLMEKPLAPFIHAYCLDRGIEIKRFELLKLNGGQKVKNLIYIYDNCYRDAEDKERLTDDVFEFAEWLCFDIYKNIAAYRQKIERKGGVKSRDIEILKLRAGRLTLEEIGARYGVTRERVRQIAARTVKILKNFYSQIKPDIMIAIYALEGGAAVINKETAALYLADLTDTVFYIIREDSNAGNKAYKYSQELDAVIIDGGANYNGNREAGTDPTGVLDNFIDSLPEIIEERTLEEYIRELCENRGINEDYAREYIYASVNRYGVMRCKNNPSYKAVFDYILKTHYKDGFKTGDEDSALEIIDLAGRLFGKDLTSHSQHSIDAIIGRVGVLNGRGLYIHPSLLEVDGKIIDEVNKYIERSDRTLFTFNELYYKLNGLFEETPITSGNALHGALKYYGTPYYTNRDNISKEEGLTFDGELERFALERGSFLKSDVMEYFGGVAESQIVQALDRSEKIFNMENGRFAYAAGVFDIDEEDYALFEEYLKRAVNEKYPLHIETAYEELSGAYPDFFKRNEIADKGTLYAVLNYMFNKKYKFARPYISVLGSQRTTNKSVLLNYISGAEKINIEDLKALLGELNINYQSLAAFLKKLAPEYYRADSQYLVSARFAGIDRRAVSETAEVIREMLKDNDYIVLSSIEDFWGFPELNIPYTDFLLESILGEADIKTVSRNARGGSNCPAVVLSKKYQDAPDYESFIIRLVKDQIANGIFNDKNEISKWLKKEGLAGERAPYWLEDDRYFYYDENGILRAR